LTAAKSVSVLTVALDRTPAAQAPARSTSRFREAGTHLNGPRTARALLCFFVSTESGHVSGQVHIAGRWMPAHDPTAADPVERASKTG